MVPHRLREGGTRSSWPPRPLTGRGSGCRAGSVASAGIAAIGGMVHYNRSHAESARRSGYNLPVPGLSPLSLRSPAP
jgi:hypothetical protein